MLHSGIFTISLLEHITFACKKCNQCRNQKFLLLENNKKNGFGKYVFLTGILVQKVAVVLIGGRIGFPLPTGRVKIVLILFRFSLFANPSGGNDYFSKNFGNLN